ncbi:MAG: 8-oxo-dGTP diphosphatase [Lentisphaerae bacterium ADurb.Bin242]|nr:MAG: 8-oxo-dGTP diphosphatase [Lentisphaerae bacterium ADurb.Bin242]
MICELTNMCMITDSTGRVLVQDRLPTPTNAWSGLTFPGGHVEPGESIIASVTREVLEETGLTISDIQNCGYVQWYNPKDRSKYIVFLFHSSAFTGELKSSTEGHMEWMTLSEMESGKLAPNMEKYAYTHRSEIEQKGREAFATVQEKIAPAKQSAVSPSILL